MTLRFKLILTAFLVFVLAYPLLAQTTVPLTQKQKELHILNRLTFGPRAQDLEHIHKIGIQSFIAEQLNPEKINDSVCDKDLKKYELIAKTTEELMTLYPDPANPIRRPDMKGKIKDKKSADQAYHDINNMCDELASAKLTRAAESNRQLQEIMVDFWFNHFNVHFWKNEVPWLIISYERDIIRPHVLGKFRDLLLAVAQSPAMLVYLDNSSNRASPNPNALPNPEMKLNENYGRELLELHTVGVDGGYNQKDVTEAARVLTGWGITGMNYNSAPVPVGFKFKPYQHDPGTKVVMGHSFGPDGGVEEGVQLMDFLGHHPSTAHFIALKLCRHFVSDNPTKELVGRVSQTFKDSDGDIRETLKAIFDSPEFTDPENYHSKVKTPFEYVVSSLRAAGTTILGGQDIIWKLHGMGEPLYLCETPTGYPDIAKAWLGSGSLLGRINFVGDLFSRPYGGYLRTDIDGLAGNAKYDDGKAILNNFIHSLLLDEISDGTRAALEKEVEKPEISQVPLAGKKKGVDIKKVAALVLSTPDFQKR